MKKLLFLFVAAQLLLSCGQDKAIIKELDNKAVAVHDEVMPKMGEIIELKSELKAKLTAIDTTDVASMAAHLDMLTRLQAAEEGMKDWMHGYVAPDFKLDLETLQPLAEKQLSDIEAVKTKMESSITDARALLGK
jgi:hypothetical protein